MTWIINLRKEEARKKVMGIFFNLPLLAMELWENSNCAAGIIFYGREAVRMETSAMSVGRGEKVVGLFVTSLIVLTF